MQGRLETKHRKRSQRRDRRGGSGTARAVKKCIEVWQRDNCPKADAQNSRTSKREANAQDESRLPTVTRESSCGHVAQQKHRAQIEMEGAEQTYQRDSQS